MTYRDDNELDRALRALAQTEPFALPEELDQRLRRFAGPLRDEKIEDERHMRTQKSKRIATRLVLAAVLALMAGCMTLGALAFSSETVVEKPVPAERQEIVLEDIGLTVVLPDSWKDRYYVENTGSQCTVYCKAVMEYDSLHGGHLGGLLFGIGLGADRPMTPEEFNEWTPVPAVYLFSTEKGTYSLGFASDVQYPSPLCGEEYAQEAYDEFTGMFDEISMLQIVVSGAAIGFTGDEVNGAFH